MFQLVEIGFGFLGDWLVLPLLYNWGFAFNKERKDPLDPYQNIFFEKDLRDIFNLVRFQEKDAHSSRIEIDENVCKLKEARQTRFCDK